jgi:3-methylfumaryl-CoA hydratase
MRQQNVVNVPRGVDAWPQQGRLAQAEATSDVGRLLSARYYCCSQSPSSAAKPLPRRMWAGGRFWFDGDLCIGDAVERRSTILKVAPKEGRSGNLCFVTVGHEYLRAGIVVWREEHDIVYREDPKPGAPTPTPQPPPERFDRREVVTPSLVMLFRYSALTFNGHRIHFDRQYAREVEGYPDLVFHGPLTATFLADFARRAAGETRLTRFSYRALSPLFDTQPFEMRLSYGQDKMELCAVTPEGGLAMTAEAVIA